LETDGEWGLSDFVLEQVLLVEEQDDGGFHKPLAVANGIKQLHRLNHAIHLLVFGQHQIVTWTFKSEPLEFSHRLVVFLCT
jgi:hypothetical protein